MQADSEEAAYLTFSNRSSELEAADMCGFSMM